MDTLREYWSLTRPSKSDYSGCTFQDLLYLYSVPKSIWYRPGFYRLKMSGGKRLIKPAFPTLYKVQKRLASWIEEIFLQETEDFCYKKPYKTGFSSFSEGDERMYTRAGVLGAVRLHRGSRFGMVFDLSDAFNYVTTAKLRYWLKYWNSKRELGLTSAVIEIIVDILTYQDCVTQGSTSSPYAFNMVMLMLDQRLKELAEEMNLKYSRYVDDIALTSYQPIDFLHLKREVYARVLGYGFSIQNRKVATYENVPISYLGTHIFRNIITLDPQKLNKQYDVMMQAIYQDNPAEAKKQVLGIMHWVVNVCNGAIPKNLFPLFELFRQYFILIGEMPSKLIMLETSD